MARLRDVSSCSSFSGWPLRVGLVSFFQFAIVSPGALMIGRGEPARSGPRLAVATSNTAGDWPHCS